MRSFRIGIAAVFILSAALAHGAEPVSRSAPVFSKVMIVILENANYKQAIAQPFLGQLAKSGALLSRSYAVARPSLPNYIALTAGTAAGVTSNRPVSLKVPHIGDLLEAKGKTWKTYAEGYPGRCFLGTRSGNYVRKHVPFLNFENVQKDARRCANIVEAAALHADVTGRKLADYSLYIPDENNNGHDSGVAFADRWLAQIFGPLLQNPVFGKGLLFVVTFDEADEDRSNHIYTALAGEPVLSGSLSTEPYNHYNLLRTVEDALGLGTFGKNDASVSSIAGIWR